MPQLMNKQARINLHIVFMFSLLLIYLLTIAVPANLTAPGKGNRTAAGDLSQLPYILTAARSTVLSRDITYSCRL